MPHEFEVQKQMKNQGIYPSESMGQHILVDRAALSFFAENVISGGSVLEVGSGPGNITALIAERARRVVGVEIDRKFEPLLTEVQHKYPNVEVTYKDILSMNLGNIIKGNFFRSNWQIMSNLPFHIIEPFFAKIIDLPFNDAVLILGSQMVGRIQIDNPDNFEFSKTGLLVQSFFDSSVVMDLPRSSFYPQPRTDSAIVVLSPKNKVELRGNPKTAILRKLFLTESNHSPISKVIKEAVGQSDDDVMRDKIERNRYDRRKVKQDLRATARDGLHASYGNIYSKSDYGLTELGKLDLPTEILSRPFSNIDNQDLRNLVSGLNKRYG
jgi:16S rRNA (adenine1518-N6/adenine1519-N6)-dimethyltransferase